MNRMVSIILFVLSSFTVTSQGQTIDPPNRGTYCMVAITKNGIVAMSDSRVVHFESDDHSPIYAYFDGLQKVFCYDGIFFQALGQYSFSKYTMWGLFQRFSNENAIPTNPRNFFSVFSDFAQSILTGEDFSIFSKNNFLVSGYSGTMPSIYLYIESKLVDSVLRRGYLTGEVRHNGNSMWFNFFDTASLQESIEMFTRLVDNYSQPTRLAPISKIGGPISYGVITVNGKLQAQFQEKYNYLTKKEEIIAALNDEIPIVYRSRSDSITYKHALRDYLKASK